MSSWGLAFISIGCILIMVSASNTEHYSLIITGITVVVVGIFMLLKGKKGNKK